MKKNLDNYIIDTITRSSKFKILFILSIFLAFYGAYGLGANNKDFFGTILISFSSGYFNLGFSLLLFVNTIYFCSWFSRYDNYIIRLHDKKSCLKQMICQGLKLNLILMICFLLIYFIFLFFTNFGYFQGSEVFNYGITSHVYVVFYLIRYFCFSCFLSLFIICFYVFLGEKKTILFSLVFFIGYIITLFLDVNLLDNSFKILPYSYYTLYDYSTFSLEIVYSILYLLLLELFFYILIYIFLRRKKHFLSYIIRQDGNFIWNNKKIYFVFLILIPGIVFIVNLFSKVTGIDLFMNALGLKINLDDFYALQYILYYYNILVYLVLAFSIYLKDYQGNLEYLFLRTDFKEFYLQKTISFMFYNFILMISQYIVLSLIAFLGGASFFRFELVLLFIYEYFFISLFQQVILLGCFLSCSFPKLRIIVAISGVLLLFVLPKNILKINIWLTLFMLCVVVILNSFIHKKYNKKIIQVMGGV